jgi:hypothetical protein
MVERRREPRQRSLLGARLSFNHRQSTMDCLVRNISPNGALIVFEHAAVTPREFHVEIPTRAETRSATVIWRNHDRAGVAFAAAEPLGVPADTALRLKALQAEYRRLRRQLDPTGV